MGDTGSVHSYRLPSHAGQTSASASGSVKSGYAPAAEVQSIDGDELQGMTMTGRSSSPISNMSLSGDEVTLPSTSGSGSNHQLVALRRSARRARFGGGSSSQQQQQAAASDSDCDHGSGQVRFDEHVNYIDRCTAALASSASADASEDDQSESTWNPRFIKLTKWSSPLTRGIIKGHQEDEKLYFHFCCFFIYGFLFSLLWSHWNTGCWNVIPLPPYPCASQICIST